MFSNITINFGCDNVLRRRLLSEINSKINENRKTQKELAQLLETTQPRVSALRKGKVSGFRLDMLFDFSVRLDLNISLNVAA